MESIEFSGSAKLFRRELFRLPRRGSDISGELGRSLADKHPGAYARYTFWFEYKCGIGYRLALNLVESCEWNRCSCWLVRGRMQTA